MLSPREADKQPVMYRCAWHIRHPWDLWYTGCGCNHLSAEIPPRLPDESILDYFERTAVINGWL